MPAADGGLGAHLVGDKIQMGAKPLHVTKLLGEGTLDVNLRVMSSASTQVSLFEFYLF